MRMTLNELEGGPIVYAIDLRSGGRRRRTG